MPPLNSLVPRASIAGNVCTTPGCISASAFVKSYVNLTVDPCSDFYEYTCGSWLNSPRVSASEVSIDGYQEVHDNNLHAIFSILEGTYEDIFRKLKTNDEGFHTTDEAGADRSNFQEIQSFYDTCTNLTHIESLGPSSLYHDIAQIQHTLFPLPSANAGQNLARTFASFVRQGGSSLISGATLIDAKNHEYNMAAITGPSFGGTNADYETSEFLTKLVNWIMGNGHSNVDWIEVAQKTNLAHWSYKKVQVAVESYLGVTEACKRMTSVDDISDPSNVKTLRDLEEISPTIDWVTFLDDLVSPGYAQPTTPVIFDALYLKQLDRFLQTKSLEEIQDFFIVRLIVTKISDIFIPFEPTPKGMSDNTQSPNSDKNNFRAHLKQGISNAPASFLTRRSPSILSTDLASLRADCADITSKNFPDSVGRFFALQTFGAAKEKLEVEQFVNDIQTTMLNRLPNTVWLDDETKARAIEKIKALQGRVAYNTVNPDWRSPASIKSFNEGFTVDKSSFYNAKRDITAFRNNQVWKQLALKVATNQWSKDGYPHNANALYQPYFNEFEIPIGIIQRIFYDSTFPKYLNFGGLGRVIGHELSHALDSDGKKYNSLGYLENWWTNRSDTEFQKRSQCFIDQYSKEHYYNQETKTKTFVDGSLTLGENIADNGGLAIALAAYRYHINKNGQQPEPLLPGFEKLTQEQLFFIGYGISRCASIPPDLNGLDFTDVHAPSPTRLVVPMRNNADFAKAFKCAVGTPMNPYKNDEEKCTIW